jgi:general secretion pathway protein D
LKNKTYFVIFLGLIFTFLIVTQINAQTPADNKTSSAETGTKMHDSALSDTSQQKIQISPEQSKTPETVSQPQKAVPTVSFFFDDADIFEVVQTIFADVLKVNYIIDPQVKGRVNFRTVTPIPKDEVLNVMEIIFRLNGIGFVEEAGLYRIVPLPDVSKELVYAQIGKAPEKVAIDMFTFKNLELKEAMPDIENALGLHLKGGTVRIVPVFRMNALIVVASGEEQLSYIKKWIEVFDKMFAVAKPKIFVYPLQNSKATHIASLLQSIFTGSAPASTTATTQATTPVKIESKAGTGTTTAVSQTTTAPRTGAAATVTGGGGFVSPETRAFADEITNSLIILATPTDYSFIEETIKKLDVLPRQVMIEALIAEITLSDEFSFGLAWSLKTNLKISGVKPFINDVNLDGQISQRGDALSGDSASKLTGGGFTFLATDPTGIVRARIESLTSDSRAKVLASPRILVLDNREAKIQIGDQVPVSTSETTYTGSDTGNITRTIQYKDTGVILKVKPQVNEGGLVTLELSQEVSNFYKIDLSGNEEIAISKRETNTNLVSQDGQTIVIGGLISEEKTDTKSGIPYLSKIPIIGPLFGTTKNQNKRKELVILLTPHVIRNQQEAGTLTSEYLKRLDKDVGKDVSRITPENIEKKLIKEN